MLPVRSAGEEARAATHLPSLAGAGGLAGDPLLGALSFSSSREPIAVTANTLEFDYRSRVLTYKGDVVVTQGNMTLQSSRLTVALDDAAENRVKEVVADGHVRLSKGTRWATGEHATFDQTHHTVVLSDDAVVHDGANQVSGERIVVYLDQERSIVEGGSGRVKAVLFPSKSEATPGADKGAQ